MTWSLYAGSITWKLYLWGLVKCGLYNEVVFIYRWSLEQLDCMCDIVQSVYWLYVGLNMQISVHL